MNKKSKLKKICHHCNKHYEVTRNRKTQKFCSRDCAANAVRRHVPAPLKKQWSKTTEFRSDKREPPFHKSSTEVALAVQKFLASGGKVTTLTSQSVTKDAEIVAGGSDLEEVRQVTKPLNRDRSIMKGHFYRD